MALTKEKKAAVVNNYKLHEKDTGTPSVQVALLTQKILALSEHLKEFSKDFASRQGLLRMVGQRRKLLNYLKANDRERYQGLIQKLDLRK